MAESTELGITIHFQGEAVQFDKGVDGMNKALRLLKKDVKMLNQDLKNLDPKSIETLTAKMKNLSEQEELAKKIMDTYVQDLVKLAKSGKYTDAQFSAAQKKVVKAHDELVNIKKQIQNTNEYLAHMNDKWGNIADKIERSGEAMQNIGNAMGTVGNVLRPVTNFLNESVDSAIAFEDAFADVRKTLEINGSTAEETEERYMAIADSLRQMATEVPTAADELARIAGLAGQMGVGEKDIVSFTKAMVDFGNATNISAEEAAQEIAQIYNVIGKAGDYSTLENLLSTIVHLGNNSATTEKDIVEMFRNISAASSRIGMTEQQMAALAATLSSLGLDKGGASAISTIMSKIDMAVATNSKELKEWAANAQMSVKDFKSLWQEDAAGALVTILEGLKKTVDAGGNLNEVFQDLNIKELRRIDTMGRLVNGQEVYTNSLEMANEAFKDGTALSDEANKRYQTMASRLQILKNTFNEVMMQLGDSLMPVLSSLVGTLQSIAEWLGNLDPEIVKIAAFVTMIIGTLGSFLIMAGRLVSSLGALAKVLGPIVKSVGTLGGSTLKMVGIIGAVVAALILLYNNSEEFRNLINDIAKMIWNKVQPAFSNLVDVCKNLWDIISYLFDKLMDLFDLFMQSAAGEFFKKTIMNIVDALTAFIEILGYALGWLRDLLGLFKKTIGLVNDVDYSSFKVIKPTGSGAYSSGGFSVTLNNSFNVSGDPSQSLLKQWADVLTDQVNENLGRMYAG